MKRRRTPLQEYLKGMLRYPARTLSDIALDKPLLRAFALLVACFMLAGAALGATGLPGLDDGLRGLLGGMVAVPLVGVAVFLVLSVAFHVAAKMFEGIGSYSELVSALAFAMLPFALLAPASLLRIVPIALSPFLFFVACMVVTCWLFRWAFVAVRVSHRFADIQAIIAVSLPLIAVFLFGLLGIVVSAMLIPVFF